MQRATVVVNLGLTDDALTISGLSPVALMERPSLVDKNHTSRTDAVRVMMRTRTISENDPNTPVFLKRVKMVSVLRRLTFELQPMTMRFMV